MRAIFVALVALVGCGGSGAPTPPPPTSAGDPELGRAKPVAGEILIRGELGPATHGPYEFDGRYRVAFEQFAPEDPALDFRGETPFIARAGSTRLFRAARRTQARTVVLRGSRSVDVSYGDYPYVIRFTPRRAGRRGDRG